MTTSITQRAFSRPWHLATSIAAIFFATNSQAAPFLWDVTPGLIGSGDSAITDGLGTWDLTAGNWTTDAGANNVAWVDGNDAIFGGGTSGTAAGVTIQAGGVSATSLTFNTPFAGSYSLSGGNLALTGAALITANTSASIASVITGTAGLIKEGSGNLTLTAQNTFSGNTTVNAGTLTLADAVNNDTGAITGAVTVNSGATLAITTANALGYGTNKVNVLNVNSGTVTSSINADNGWGISINLTSGTISGTNGGRFTLGAGSTINSLAAGTSSIISAGLTLRESNPGNVVPFDVADGAAAVDLLVSGVIGQANGAFGITKTGSGTMELSAANTYTGTTTVNSGTLVFSRTANGDGNGTIHGPLVVNAGATALSTAGDSLGWQTNQKVTSIAINGGALNHTANVNLSLWGAPATLTAGTIAATNLTLANNRIDIGNGSSIASAAAATSSFINGRLNLRQAVTTITVADGTAVEDLVINAAILGSTANAQIAKAGDGTLVLRNNLASAGASTWNAGHLNVTAGTVVIGTTNVTPNAANAIDLTIAQGATVTNAAGVTHSHIRNLTLNGGTLTAGNATDSYDGENYQLNGNVTVGGTTVSTITRDASRSNANSGLSLNGGRTFTVNDAVAGSAVDLVVSTELENSDTTPADDGLTKAGPGTMQLTVANSYSGSTTVSAGTLLVSGSITGTGTVSVASGATLGGTGSVAGAVSVIGTLGTNGAPETLALGALSLNDTSTLAVKLDSSAAPGAAADLLLVGGALNLAGTVNLTLDDIAATDAAFSEGLVFSLINYSGAWNGGLLTVNGSNSLDDGERFTMGLNTWEIDYNGAAPGANFAGEAAYSSYVNLIAVPEPSAALSLLGGMGMLVGFRRSRRR